MVEKLNDGAKQEYTNNLVKKKIFRKIPSAIDMRTKILDVFLIPSSLNARIIESESNIVRINSSATSKRYNDNIVPSAMEIIRLVKKIKKILMITNSIDMRIIRLASLIKKLGSFFISTANFKTSRPV